MKVFRKKGSIVWMVVLAMLLQIVGPVVSNVYAEVIDKNFEITVDINGDTATVNWEYTFAPNGDKEYTLPLNFTLTGDEEESGKLEADGTIIGTHIISKDGKMTVTIVDDIEEIVMGLSGESGEPTAPIVPVVPGEPVVPEAPGEPTSGDTKNPDGDASIDGTDTTEGGEGADVSVDADVTDGTDEGSESGDPNGTDETNEIKKPEGAIIGKVLGLFASTADIGGLLLGSGEEVKTYTFSGSFVVVGVEPIGPRAKSMNLSVGDLGNIFTSVTLKVNGEVIDENTQIEVIEDMEIYLDYTWKIPDNQLLKAGDMASIIIPDFFGDFFGASSGGKISSESYGYVGDYVIHNNVLTFTFDSTLEDKIDRSGIAGIRVKFNLEKFEEDVTQEIDFQYNLGKTILTIKPKNVSEITKSVKDPVKNDKVLEWTIDVNTKLEELENATVVDTIPDGLILDQNSIEIFKLKVGYGGSLKPVDNNIASSSNVAIENNKLTVTLGKTNEAYRIKYKTNIEDYSKFGDSYKNEATLKDSEIQKGDKVAIPVPKVELGELIKKAGTAKPGKTDATSIEWTITVNESELNLKDVVVSDENLPKWSTIDPGSIKIYKSEKNSGTWSESEITGENIFPISLGDINGEKYRIVFSTDIGYEEYNPKETFTNEAKITHGVGEDKASATAKADVEVTRSTILEKNGKEISKYDKQEFEWTIHVNKTKQNLPVGTTLKDTIPEGLELDLNSIVVKENGNIIDKGSLSFSENNNIFTMNLKEGKNTYEIYYKTKITNTTIDNFNNKVELIIPGLKGTYGDGKGGTGTIGEGKIDVNKDANVNVKNLYEKKAVNGLANYEEKTMSWKITIDPIKRKITELTITDTFEPEKSMLFLADTLKVRKGGTLLTLGETEDYTIKDNGVGGFVLEFKKTLEDAKYEISYDTSFDPNKVGKVNTGTEYKNKAELTITTVDKDGGNPVNETVSLSAKYNTGKEGFNDDGGKKIGTLHRENRKIDWSIYINALGRNLTGEELKVVDTFESGQELETTSLRVFEYTLDANGKEKLGEEITLLAGQFTSNENLDGFTLTFTDGINKPIMIKYTTSISGISEEYYKNTAEVRSGKFDTSPKYLGEVKNVPYNQFIKKGLIGQLDSKEKFVYKDEELNWEVTLNTSLSQIHDAKFIDTISSGHEYVIGSLEVYKRDYIRDGEGNITSIEDTRVPSLEKSLKVKPSNEGTELSLDLEYIEDIYTIKYKTVVISATGKITNDASFGGKELTSNRTTKREFTADVASYATGGGVNKGYIEITKVSKEEPKKPLLGAGFGLWYILNGTERRVDINGSEIFYTNHNGIFEFKGLAIGRKYIIRELKAPDGYAIGDVKEWEITASDEVYQLKVENESIETKIKIPVEKYWVGEYEEGTEVTIILEQDETKRLTLNKNNSWKDEFQDIPKFNAEGNEIQYSIRELPAEGFGTVIGGNNEGFVVTNTREGKVSIAVTKEWIGLKANSVEIILLGDGVESDRVTLNDENNWTHTFINLEQYKDGKEITYKVHEVSIRNYKSTIVGENGSFKIINRYIPPVDPDPTDPDPKDPPKEPEKPVDPDPTDPPKPPVDPPTEPTEPTEPPTNPEVPEQPKEPEKPTEPIKETTPKDTPKEGEIPKDSEPKVNNPPENGTVTIDENGKWTYTPNPGFVGKDKFSIIITHPDGTEEEIFIEIDVEDPLGGIEVEKETLPKTGQINSVLLYLVGLLFVVVGIVLRRRKTA